MKGGNAFTESGITRTGLWQPRVHIDVAFWFFDVGSSYSRIAAGSMDKIVHLLTGNVSWVKIIFLNPH